MTVRVKRIYEPVAQSDGCRLLVDRLWPRVVKKEEAHIDAWIKDIAPSAALRKWFGHDPAKWKEFCNRYRAELKDNPSLEEFMHKVASCTTVTLLYAAKEEDYNHARFLKEWIAEQGEK